MARPTNRPPHPTSGSAVHLLACSGTPSLTDALAARGCAVRIHADLPALLAALEEGERGRVVVTIPEERSRETLAAVAALRRLDPALPLIVLLEASPPSPSWARAAALTSACFPASLDPGALGDLVLQAGGPAAPPPRRRLPRRIVLTLWESVTLDDRQVYLGVAERNFLFTLARRPGTRLPKTASVEAGAGHELSASDCRRRLGQRLGPEVAELLVPHERFEPYRLREPAEVEALTSSGGLGPVTLRVIGRGEVRLVPTVGGYA